MSCCVPCTLCPAVNSGSSVAVVCGPSANSPWPEASFPATVSANAATLLDGCSGTDDITTTAQVNKKPVMTIEKQSDVSVCSNKGSLTLQYNISSGASGLPFDITTDATCHVEGTSNNGKPAKTTSQAVSAQIG